MASWITVSIILCTFGFLKELRPSEPFVTEYIIEYKNVTAEQIIHIAFPVSTYSSVGSLAIILLITDFVRYKPIVILEGVSHVLAWGILTFSTGLPALVIVEIFYGIAGSAELAYSTYIYAQVDRDHYKQVTSQTHSARLAGKFLGGAIAQSLVTWKLMNYHQLNYITLTCISVGMICTLFLPKVKINQQCYLRSYTEAEICSSESRPLKGSERRRNPTSVTVALLNLVADFKSAYSNGYVLKWSMWWAIASAGQYQVVNYVQALWERIREDGGEEQELFNGAVKAIHTLSSALLSFGFQFTNVKWKKWGELTLTLISVVQGVMLIWMATTPSLNLAYLSYIVFRLIHPVMLTVASSEVAQNIRKESHGLIFGINMFFALVLQTLLTITISDMRGFALDERNQFIMYGIFFALLGVMIGGSSLFSVCINVCTKTANEHREEGNLASDNDLTMTAQFNIDSPNPNQHDSHVAVHINNINVKTDGSNVVQMETKDLS